MTDPQKAMDLLLQFLEEVTGHSWQVDKESKNEEDHLIANGVTVHNGWHTRCLRMQLGMCVFTGKKIQEWVDYARQTRWRRFAEEKPLLGDRVLCTNGRCVFEQVLCVKKDGTYKWDRCGLPAAMQDVTYWMPLPEPPKEDNSHE